MSHENEWEFSVSWYIEDYSFYGYENGKILVSPVFTVEAFNKTQWYLSIYPGGINEDSKEYISAFLYKSKDNKPDEKNAIEWVIQLKSCHKELIKTSKYSKIFGNDEGSGPYNLIKREEVLSEMKNCYSDILSMHCLMKKQNDETTHSTKKKEIRTRILTDKCSFEWEMNFIKCTQNIKTETFFFLGTQFYQINLDFMQEDIVINQMLGDNSLDSNQIIGEIALLDSGEKVVFSKRSNFIFDTNNQTWKFPAFFTKNQVINNINEYAVDKEIVFLCNFFLLKKSKPETLLKSTRDTFSDIKNLMELRHDFQNMLNKKINADVKLRVSDEVVVQAHSSVLAARSPVFAAMFDQDMLEKRTGVIDIADVDFNTLTYFLEFLYTGNVGKMDSEKAFKLVVVADKYEVLSLKEECTRLLISTLTVDNVCETLILADMILHEHLKKACIIYAANNVAAIFSSPDRLDLVKDNSKLFAEIFTNLEKTSFMLKNK